MKNMKRYKNKIQILSQVSADTNNMSRVVSIINDETQRGWNLSMTDMEQEIQQDEEINLEVRLIMKK